MNKYLDLAGLTYFKNKLKTSNEQAITTAINEALSQFKADIITVVSKLPTTGEEGKMYLVPQEDGTYFTYTWEDNEFKPIGKGGINVDVDLSNYYTKTEANSTFVKAKDLVAITNEEIDEIMV